MGKKGKGGKQHCKSNMHVIMTFLTNKLSLVLSTHSSSKLYIHKS